MTVIVFAVLVVFDKVVFFFSAIKINCSAITAVFIGKSVIFSAISVILSDVNAHSDPSQTFIRAAFVPIKKSHFRDNNIAATHVKA